MSFFIQDEPAQKHLVMKAAKLMKHNDFEFLAMAVEFFRSQGKPDCRKKITSKILYDAICFVEKYNSLDSVNEENVSVPQTPKAAAGKEG